MEECPSSCEDRNFDVCVACFSLCRWVTESGVDPGGDVLAVKPAAAAIGVGYLRARGAEEAMEAAKAMLDQACASLVP